MKKIKKVDEKTLHLEIIEWGIQDVWCKFQLFDENGTEIQVPPNDKPIYQKMALREALDLLDNGGIK